MWRPSFRPLAAEVPGNLLAAQVAATSRHAETATTPAGPDAWIPAPEHPEIWAALAAASNSNGVIDRSTPGPTTPTGEN